MVKNITEWALESRPLDPFTPPECRPASSISGVLENGQRIITSPIVGVRGRVVTTASGTKYRLVGAPLQAFVDWALSKGYVGFDFITARSPLRVFKHDYF